MSPEIGAQRQFIERRGGPAYDWDETTLTIDTAIHALDLSSIVPSNAVWVKFHAVVTAGTASKALILQNQVATGALRIQYGMNNGADGKLNHEVFLKPSSPQTAAYLIQVGITALTLKVLGWMI
jgi:hypothetical protein